MNFRKMVLVCCIFLLVGCQPSAEDIDRAISQTQAALPTATIIPSPTPISLQDIDLSQVIFVPGDLPAGFEPSQVRSSGRIQPGNIASESINMFHQDVTYQGDDGGRVSIYLFETPETALNAYLEILYSKQDGSIPLLKIDGLGEQSFGQNIDVPLIGGGSIQASIVVFIRCNAVMAADLRISSAYNGLKDYSKRLDKRLADLTCK